MNRFGFPLALLVSVLLWALIFLGVWVAVAGAATINGSAADDYLVGTPNADTISGGSGKDELHGRSGDDLLKGGSGADLLEGAAGNDYMIGGRGGDVLYAWGSGSGIDTLSCGGGVNDWAYMGPLDTALASCENVVVLP